MPHLMEGEFQYQGQLDQELEERLSPRGSQSVHGFFSEKKKQELSLGVQIAWAILFVRT